MMVIRNIRTSLNPPPLPGQFLYSKIIIVECLISRNWSIPNCWFLESRG